MSQSRFVLDSNHLWLVGNPDGTVSVLDGPDIADPTPTDANLDVSAWEQIARIGSTHKELEVFGVALTGRKLEELSKNAYDHQVTVNREGYMVQWLNPGGGGDRSPKKGNIYRRLNDLFDWTKHGVAVPLPVDPEFDWDRYQLGTGELMVEVTALTHLPRVVEELEAEMQTVRDDADLEIRELQKQLQEKAQGGGGGGGGGKEKEIADKDTMIDTLKAALKLFL